MAAVPGKAQASIDWSCISSQNVCFRYAFVGESAYVYFPPGVADPDLGDNVFDKGEPDDAGYGQVVAGNIRGATNLSDNFVVILCTGVNYTGTCRITAPNDNWPAGDPFLLTVRSFRWGVGA